MNDLTAIPRSNLPIAPTEAKKQIAITKAAVQYAAEMRDWEKLGIAIDEMISIQRQFVDWWKKSVRRKGGDGGYSDNADHGYRVSVEDAENATKISQQQVSNWGKRLVDELGYRIILFEHEYRKAMAQRGQTEQRGASGTGENEWYTPDQYLDAAREVLGGIDLDPASSDDAQKIVRADQYFTLREDGLKQEWHGRIWLNPPYAQPHIADFVSKMVAECHSGRIKAAIMLTHNYTDTSWFHEAAGTADAICFTRGRIRFYDAEGKIAAPTQGQAFFYFGEAIGTFASRFREVGFVICPWKEGQ